MKCKTLCLLSDKGLVSPRVKKCFEWASAANSEEDPKLQVLKPFMRRDQWGLLSWLNWWRLLYEQPSHSWKGWTYVSGKCTSAEWLESYAVSKSYIIWWRKWQQNSLGAFA